MEFKDRIAETYPELFSESNGSADFSRTANFSAKWGWYQSIYGLAQGNILNFNKVTKEKLHKCLQHLAFEKDKYELEQHILKSKTK